jgi:hypothetical protein
LIYHENHHNHDQGAGLEEVYLEMQKGPKKNSVEFSRDGDALYGAGVMATQGII